MRLVVAVLVSLGLTASGSFALAQTSARGSSTAVSRAQSGDEGLVLRARKGKVTIFVPHYAMSGGTLIALAADEIVMDPHAVLGPVDPQLGDMPAASLVKAVARKDVNRVDDRTQTLGVEAVQPGDDHRDARRRAGAGDQVQCATLGEARLHFGELFLEALLIVQELLKASRQLERRDPQELRRLTQRLLL